MTIQELLAMPFDEALGTFVSRVALNSGTLTPTQIYVLEAYFEVFARNADIVAAVLSGEAIFTLVGNRAEFERVGAIAQ